MIRQNAPVFILKTLAIAMAAASLAILAWLLPGQTIATLLKLQALALTASALTNLGAVPFVAEAYASGSATSYGSLRSWLNRRWTAAVLVAPLLTLAAQLGQGASETALFAVLVTLWACAYSYDLSDVALVSVGAPLYAAVSSNIAALVGLVAKVLVALSTQNLMLLLCIAAGEVMLRFGIQLARLRALDARTVTRQTPADAVVRTSWQLDAPIYISSFINSAAVRADQFAASAFLHANDSVVYLLVSRFVDAAWFLPFTTINLALSKQGRSAGPSDQSSSMTRPAAQIAVAILLTIASLLVVAVCYAFLNRAYADVFWVMSIMCLTMFVSAQNAVAWRLEAARSDKVTGLKRSIIQLVVLLSVIALVQATWHLSAISLAASLLAARAAGVVLSLIFLKEYRQASTRFFRL